MNIWQQFENKRCTAVNKSISFHYERGIDAGIKREFMHFANWLRKNYIFPVHLNVYIVNREKVKLLNGSMAYGSFRWFTKRTPRVKVPVKIEPYLLQEYSYDEVCEQMLSSLVHELTHYFQWVEGLQQSNAVSERQANYYRYRVIETYKKSND